MIEYKRGRRDETTTAHRMTWESRCGRFKVQECTSKLDGIKRYYALVDGRMLEHMKTYKTRKTAERALQNTLSKPIKSSRRGRNGKRNGRKLSRRRS